MRRLLVLLLLSPLLVLGRSPAVAGACSCGESTPADRASRADVVFVGALVEARPEFPEDQLDDAVDRTISTFAVERVYRGEVAEAVEVVSEADPADCGASFEEGRHLVYATREEHSGDLRTSLCHGNRVVGDDPAGIPAELGPGVAPVTAPDEGAEPAPAGAEEDDAPTTTWPPIGGPEGDVVEPGVLDTFGPALLVLGGLVALAAGAGVWAGARRRSS